MTLGLRPHSKWWPRIEALCILFVDCGDSEPFIHCGFFVSIWFPWKAETCQFWKVAPMCSSWVLQKERKETKPNQPRSILLSRNLHLVSDSFSILLSNYRNESIVFHMLDKKSFSQFCKFLGFICHLSPRGIWASLRRVTLTALSMQIANSLNK